MKKHITSLTSYCVIFVTVLLLGCKGDTNNEEKPPVDPGTGKEDAVASISLFSADSVVLAETLSFQAEGGSQGVVVDANVKGWTLQIQGNDAGDAPWLTCEPALGAVGRTELTLVVAANAVEIERHGVVTFVQDSTGLAKVVAVSQKGIDPLQTDMTTDSMALIALYTAWDGKGLWKDLWDLKKPVGTWTGLQVSLVDGKRRVTGLDIQSTGPKGDMIVELGNLRELTSLTLVLSRVKGAIPNGLSFAKNLKTIYLRGSLGITGLPKDIGFCENLEVLDIAGTAVAQLPESLSKCTKLKDLNASPMSEKAKLPLSGNLNKILSNKPELLSASFGKTELTGDLAFLKETPKLTKFQIATSKMAGDLNLEENLKNSGDSLEYLRLGSSPDLTGTLAGLKQAKRLASFEIMDSKVGGTLDQAELHLLPNNVSIWIPNNEFTGQVTIDFISRCGTACNISMNKLSGTITDDIKALIKPKFIFSERFCLQKEGFVLDNCPAVL